MWSEEHCINAAISIVSSGGQMAKHILSLNCPFMTDKVDITIISIDTANN